MLHILYVNGKKNNHHIMCSYQLLPWLNARISQLANVTTNVTVVMLTAVVLLW